MRTLPFLRDGHMIIFHVDVFPFFAGFPRYDNILPSSASFRSANTPFLGFFGVFPSHTHIYITDSCFPSSDVLSFRWCFPSLNNTDRFSPLVLAATVPGAVAVGCRSRSFSRLSPPVSDGLSAQTKWRLVVSTPLIRGGRGGEGGLYSNIRREGEEGGRRGRRGESSWVFGIVRKPVLCSFASLRFQSVGDSGALPFPPSVLEVIEANWLHLLMYCT